MAVSGARSRRPYRPATGIYIGGSTQNATQNGAYLQVAANGVSGSTVTFTNTVVTEQNQTILIAPVVTNLQNTDESTAGALTASTVNFGDNGNSGTITLTSGTWGSNYVVGGGIYVQSPTDVNANGSGAFSPTANNAYYTISGVSADDKTSNSRNGARFSPARPEYPSARRR